jgi:MFS family permease
MVFSLFMPMLDHLVLNVALPTIQRELGTGVSGVQWIVDGYTLAFAALLLTGGALGDLFGRKRFYLAGSRSSRARRRCRASPRRRAS